MSLLRITQTAIDGNRYRADLRLEDDGAAPLEAASEFEFRLTAQDEEDLRWYLEDFLQGPHDAKRGRTLKGDAKRGRESFSLDGAGWKW